MGQPPYGRFSGELRPMRDEPLMEESCNRLIFSMLNNSQRKTLEQTWELDCAYGLKGVACFRVNVYRQKGSYAACLRALGSSIPSIELLNLPPVVVETSERPRGLVLVTGPTGSGKTTTLAALLDHINHSRAEHILTIEDPIEFVYKSDRSLVHQRQLNEDTRSFANALPCGVARGPGRDPGGGNAGSGNDSAGDQRSGNRPPGVRHPAHQFGRPDRGPHGGCVPPRAADSDPRATLREAWWLCSHRPSVAAAIQLLDSSGG